MKKRWIVATLIAVVLAVGSLSLLFGVFPEKVLIPKNADAVESIEVDWRFRGKQKATVTDRADIDAFFDALQESSDFHYNAIVTHSEGLYSEPVYTLEVFYKNGKTVYLTTGEGGEHVYRFLDPTHRGGGDKSYVSVYTPALREWAESMM